MRKPVVPLSELEEESRKKGFVVEWQTVHGIGITMPSGWNELEMAEFALPLKWAVWLQFLDTKLTSAVVPFLCERCERLEHLTLTRSEVDVSVLRDFVNGIKSVRQIDLLDCASLNIGAEAIAASLRSIRADIAVEIGAVSVRRRGSKP